MTETQAKAGAAGSDGAGSSAKPGPDGSSSATSGTAGGSATPPRGTSAAASGTAPASGTAAGAAGSLTGERSIVGRATVPGDTAGPGGTKYRRPAGMPAPPDSAPASAPAGSGVGAPVGASAAASSAQTSTIPAVARASVRAGGAGGYGLGGLTSSGATAAAPSGAARVTEAVRAARATVSAAVGRGPRRARLHVKRIDPWSVMKFSFAVSFVLLVVVIVATSVLYLALDAMGVFDSLNKALKDIVGATAATGENSKPPKVTAYGVIGGAFIVGVVNVVLFTALSTLGAFIYNVCADLVGGVEITLAEKD